MYLIFLFSNHYYYLFYNNMALGIINSFSEICLFRFFWIYDLILLNTTYYL